MVGPEAMTDKRYATFQEFWPHYVREHGHRVNRRLHYVGTSLGLLIVVAAIVFQRAWLLALAPVFGYGFAWIGHFVVQKNRPASFAYPLWSLRGDFKMLFLMLRGRMQQEVTDAFRASRETSRESIK